MAIVNMNDMLKHAYENNYAIGAFDLVSLDFLEAVISAAEDARAPVILSVAEPHFVHYDYELMLAAVEAAAKRATIPVAIQLDHGQGLDSSIKAINLGCNAITVDLSKDILPQNIKVTRTVVEMAHQCGVPVIGEIGSVATQVHSDNKVITSSEAAVYVERTGVDALSMSVNDADAHQKGKIKLDYKRLKEISEKVKIPLVIHGGSSLTEDQFRRLASVGVAKINYFTALSDLAAQAIKTQIKQHPQGNFVDYKVGVKDAIYSEVKHCLKLWGSAGRAAEVLTQCAAWEPVIKVIMLDVLPGKGQVINDLMAEGCRVISNIPGVREVFIGQAPEDAKKQHLCWVVKFCHKQAAESYQNDSSYVEFSKNIKSPIRVNDINLGFQASLVARL